MEENKENNPQWKGCLIFGMINIGLVLLCTKLNVIVLSVSMIILIVIGVVVSFNGLFSRLFSLFTG